MIILTIPVTIENLGIWTPAKKNMKAASLHPDTARTERAFEIVFKKYYKDLFSYACTMVRDDAIAEGIVQNVFLKIWERNERLWEQQLNAPYLYRSVHNGCLNHLKHQKVKKAYQQYSANHSIREDNSTGSKLALSELQQKVTIALNELPQQCRTIFQMSRFGDMKYQEIAAELGISIKTVEAQMGKALKVLRIKLADYLPILLLTILY
jgi:RNA polymerase sigma-70 factor (ECF subfamily)